MVKIRLADADDYSRYGLRHFLFKYGLSTEFVEDGAAITIGYGDEEKHYRDGAVTVRIHRGEAGDRVVGHLVTTSGETVPLFQLPGSVAHGNEVLATFHSQGNTFPCVSASDDSLVFGFDILGEIGRILSGALDTASWETGTEAANIRCIPMVDVLEKLFFEWLGRLCQRKEIGFEGQPFWPDGKSFALCLTHDIDRTYKTYQYLPSILNKMRQLDIPGAAGQLYSILFRRGVKNPYWAFDRIMALEEQLGVKSTFFFLNESGKPSPFDLKSWILFAGRYRLSDRNVSNVVKKLNGRGFEIGVHGSYYSFNKLELLQREKRALEDITGTKTLGIRQHYLNLAPETFRLQNEAGFKYDSTVGFSNDIGFRYGTCYPFKPMDPGPKQEMEIIEIPLTIMDSAIRNWKDALERCMYVMGQVERHNGVLTLLWHQRTFGRSECPVLVEIYQTLIAEARKRNAWIANGAEIYHWLSRRRANK